MAQSVADKAYHAQWYAENRERIRAQQREYYRANREKIIARQLTRYEQKRDEILPKQAAYQRANPERYRAYAAKYYAADPEPYRLRARLSDSRRRANLSTGDLTAEEWQETLEEFDYRCAYCQASDTRLTIEHLTPLSRGGRHTASNVVPACKSCNSSKGPKTLFEFASVVPLQMVGVR